MPRKTDNAAVETEKGFGTGLRTKLEGRRSEPAQPLAEVEPGFEPGAPEVPVAEAPEPSETEQLWSELEESLAREEALKRQLEEQAAAYAEARELGRRLAERAEEIQQREVELESRLAELDAQPAAPAPEPEHGRAYLRRRVEESGDALWRVFQEALTATKTTGQPDYRIRLLAASALLAEAYGDGALSPGEQVAAARDELAGMRARRASKPR